MLEPMPPVCVPQGHNSSVSTSLCISALFSRSYLAFSASTGRVATSPLRTTGPPSSRESLGDLGRGPIWLMVLTQGPGAGTSGRGHMGKGHPGDSLRKGPRSGPPLQCTACFPYDGPVVHQRDFCLKIKILQLYLVI